MDDGTKDSVKEKSIFSKKSDAGKGDSPRRGISIKDWEKRFSRVFKKNKKST